MTAKRASPEKIKFKLTLDIYPDCSDKEIKESIECNFLGALEENNILDEESKRHMIEVADDVVSDTTKKYYHIEVKNSSEVIETLKTQFDTKNYDNLCFERAVSRKVFVDCIGIEEISDLCDL